jgi:hypothetical protein
MSSFAKSCKKKSRNNFELQHEGASTSTAAMEPHGAFRSCQNSTKKGFDIIPLILSTQLGFLQQQVTALVHNCGSLLRNRLDRRNKPGLFIL